MRLDLPCDYPDDVPLISIDTVKNTSGSKNESSSTTSPISRPLESPSSPSFYERRQSDCFDYDSAYDQLWDDSIPPIRGRSESYPSMVSDSALEETVNPFSITRPLSAFRTQGLNPLYSENDRYFQTSFSRTKNSAELQDSPGISRGDMLGMSQTVMGDVQSSLECASCGNYTDRIHTNPCAATFPDHLRTSIAGGIDVYTPWRRNGEPQMLQSCFSLKWTKNIPGYDPVLLRNVPETESGALVMSSGELPDTDRSSDTSENPVAIAHYDVQEGRHLQHLDPVDFR